MGQCVTGLPIDLPLCNLAQFLWAENPRGLIIIYALQFFIPFLPLYYNFPWHSLFSKRKASWNEFKDWDRSWRDFMGYYKENLVMFSFFIWAVVTWMYSWILKKPMRIRNMVQVQNNNQLNFTETQSCRHKISRGKARVIIEGLKTIKQRLSFILKRIWKWWTILSRKGIKYF